jgi:D-alanyl-D-alanine carboxypeptidase
MFARNVTAIIAALICLLPSLAVGGDGVGSAGRLADLLPKHARWSLVVLDLRSGGEIAAMGNAREEPLIPGSVAKLLVTGAVLDRVASGEGPEAFLPAAGMWRRGRVERRLPAEERLQRLLRDMNVQSRNRSAERLFLRLGELRFGGEANQEKGGKAMAEFLTGLGLPAGEATLMDGSGLSKDNRVPARFVARYLVEIARKPWFETFRATLPRAGMEGTVKDIGYADSRFRVKSGRLDDAFALAGYGVAPRGREVAFAFIVNVPAGKVTDRRHSKGMVVRMISHGDFP